MNRCRRVLFMLLGLGLAGGMSPAGVWAGPVSPGPIQLQLGWTYVSGNDIGFGIERATSLQGPWTRVAIVPAPATSYRDTGLRVSTTYYYRVWAYNAAGDSDYSNIASIRTPARAPSHSPPGPTQPPSHGGGVTNQPPHQSPHGGPRPPTVRTNLVPPVITGFRRSAGRGLVSFSCTNGLSYTLEYKNSLADPAWSPLPGSLTGTNVVASLIDSNAPPEGRFYRVRVQLAQ